MEIYWCSLRIWRWAFSPCPVSITLTEPAMQWQPKPSYPETEAFVRECQIVPSDYDIMGMRGTYHSTRVLQLVDRFRAWRKERPSGIRAFQSTYDRYVRSLSRKDDRIDLSFSQYKSWNDSVQVAVPVTSWHPCHLCFWLHITFDGEKSSFICLSRADCIHQPEIFRFTERMCTLCNKSKTWRAVVNDNNDLASSANHLLVRMLGVTPPVPLVSPILDAIFHTIQNSPVSIPLGNQISSLIWTKSVMESST